MRFLRPIPIALVLATAIFATAAGAAAAPAPAQAAFGAIAVNPNTGAAGGSWGQPTKKRAKRRAKRECPGRCRVVVWVRNGCAAVVFARSRYFWGIARNRARATRRARKKARRTTGVRKARRVGWVCSG